MSSSDRTGILVIGSGIAGLTTALRAAEHADVTVLAKKELVDTNTWRAQGGIATVTSADDSTDDHVEDTLRAGAGLCREDAVRFVLHSPTGRNPNTSVVESQYQKSWCSTPSAISAAYTAFFFIANLLSGPQLPSLPLEQE